MSACVSASKAEPCNGTSITLPCNHRLCVQHIRNLIREGIRDSKTSVNCPTCKMTIGDAIAAKWIDEKDEANFIYLCLKELDGTGPSFIECTRCNHLQYHLGSDTTPIVVCERCKTPYCFKHKVIWADGHKCATYGTEFKLDISSRACPKCGFFTNRINGCNYYVCPNPTCKHIFCFVCLASWVSPHGDHWICPTPPKGYDGKGNLIG